MKHERAEAVTLTKTTYSCDLCRSSLLDGERPQVCWVCERETCRPCRQITDLPGHMDDVSICVACLFYSIYHEQLTDLNEECERRRAQVIAAWKTRSLGTVENMEEKMDRFDHTKEMRFYNRQENEGRKAREEEKQLASNPYPDSQSWDHRSWAAGWAEADMEISQKEE